MKTGINKNKMNTHEDKHNYNTRHIHLKNNINIKIK